MTPSEFTAARTTLGLTQQQMAEELGVTQAAVSYWESGARPIPKPVEKLLKILLDTGASL